MTGDSALVLFSGGQDSTVCLAYALDRYARVETVGFDYGQRHDVEISCRQNVLQAIRDNFPDWSVKLGDDHMCDLRGFGAVSNTSLTRETEIEMDQTGLPSTFVPGRNLVFFNYAAAVSWRRGINRLIGGMCETDYSGYPDCRRATLDAQEVALQRGTERPFKIETPLMALDKAQTWALAEDLGGSKLVEIIVRDTHTCYLGARETLHDWGYGCGHCPACELRAAGFKAWKSEFAA